MLWCYTNKGVGVGIVAHYDSWEDPNSAPGKDTSWEGNSDYAQKGLTSFLSNREGGYPCKTKLVL